MANCIGIPNFIQIGQLNPRRSYDVIWIFQDGVAILLPVEGLVTELV